MRFQDSGLANDKLVERAFNYAQAYMQSLSNELVTNYRAAISKSYEREFDLLNLDLRDKLITQEQYDKEKASLEKQRLLDLKGPPAFVVSGTLERLFISNAVGKALEIQNHSDTASPALIAAAMLADCVRSPVDAKKIGKNFGEPLEELVGNIVDMEVYPADRSQKIIAANDDTKRILTAGLTNRFRKAAAKQEMGEKITLAPEQAENLFKEVKQLWGTDKKLDARLVSVFNQASAVLKSTYTLEVSDKELPQLINNATPPPPPPKLGPKKPTIGDEGF